MRVQELLVYGIEKREVVLFNRFPKLPRVFFAKKHDGLAGTAEVICLYAVSKPFIRV